MRYVWIDKTDDVWDGVEDITELYNVEHYGPFKRYRLEEDPESIEEPKVVGTAVEFDYEGSRQTAYYLPNVSEYHDFVWVFHRPYDSSIHQSTWNAVAWGTISENNPKILS